MNKIAKSSHKANFLPKRGREMPDKGFKTRMTITEVAGYIGCGTSNVYQAIRRGTLPSKYEGGGYVILGRDVKIWRANVERNR
ncbi:MAG: helix-turn-helix domain-containing protein [Gammaproteobacteria bacterium]